MSKTAMKLALEYISWQAFGECRIGEGPIPEAKDVVDALHQALAEPEQKPWWIQELEKHWGEGHSSHDTRRAAKVACDSFAGCFGPYDEKDDLK